MVLWKISEIRRRISYLKTLTSDNRVPIVSRFFINLGLAYLFLPFDIIPDFIPVIGHLDDAILVPGFIMLGILTIPKTLREQIKKEVGISGG